MGLDNHPTKRERREIKRRDRTTAEAREARKRFRRRIMLWLSTAAVLTAVILAAVQLAAPPKKEPPPPAPALAPVSPRDWIKGKPDAAVTLIEYSDFQCPACGLYFPVIKRLSEEFGERVGIVYRHFPLMQHPHARTAARAAEAAGRQNRFWEMHDALFAGQADWTGLTDPRDTFTGYARRIGLDLDRFLADRESAGAEDAVDEDLRGGLRAGVEGTPTFFLNGREISTPRNYGEFRDLLLQALGGSS